MEKGKLVKRTLAILVNNKSGVLMRVVGLFSRRGYNINSLSVGETEDSSISRITIVVAVEDQSIIEQIKRQVEKLVDVIRVYELTSNNSLQKELLLVKIRVDLDSRSHLVDLAEIFKAKIIDVTRQTLTLQLTGDLDKLDAFMEMWQAITRLSNLRERASLHLKEAAGPSAILNSKIKWRKNHE